MVKIDKHISELLHNHDCVIVPKMGAFISHHSLDIKKSQDLSSLVPRKISFNDLLNYNDGLLANHIAKEERLSYAEALEEIERFVFESQRDLASGKKIIVERIGILYKDSGSNILMEPIRESAILKEEIRVSPPVPESRPSEEPEPIIEKLLPPSINTFAPNIIPPKSKTPKTKTVGLFAFLIIAGVLSAFGYFYFSSESDMHSTSQPLEISLDDDHPVQKPVSTEAPEIQVPSAKPLPNIGSESSKKENKKVTVISVPSVKPVEENSKTTTGKYFYIIAGSFKSQENAKQKLAELKSQGYKNALIFTDDRSMQMVSYGRFNSREEANQSAINIKKLHKDAWVYGK